MTNSESSLAHLYLNLTTNDWVYCLDLVIPSQSYFSLPIGCHDCAQPPFLLVFIEPLVSQLATISASNSASQQLSFSKIQLSQSSSQHSTSPEQLYSKLPPSYFTSTVYLYHFFYFFLLFGIIHPSILYSLLVFLPRNLPSTVLTTVFVYRIVY